VNPKRPRFHCNFKIWDEPVSSGSLPPDFQGPDASDRRKERRFDVELHGELRYDSAAFAVQIADISGSGALIFMDHPPATGSKAELWIEDFGTLPIQIMRTGEYFCGVEFTDPARHRDRLLDWLRQEALVGGPAAAVR
jgi:hypothetical protein